MNPYSQCIQQCMLALAYAKKKPIQRRECNESIEGFRCLTEVVQAVRDLDLSVHY